MICVVMRITFSGERGDHGLANTSSRRYFLSAEFIAYFPLRRRGSTRAVGGFSLSGDSEQRTEAITFNLRATTNPDQFQFAAFGHVIQFGPARTAHPPGIFN